MTFTVSVAIGSRFTVKERFPAELLRRRPIDGALSSLPQQGDVGEALACTLTHPIPLICAGKLSLSNRGLGSLSPAIGDLGGLTCLNLCGNFLRMLPDSIGSLVHLTLLDLGVNNLEALPDTVGGLQSLEFLILTDNWLTTLPDSILRIRTLKGLWFQRNRMLEIPQVVQHLTVAYLGFGSE